MIAKAHRLLGFSGFLERLAELVGVHLGHGEGQQQLGGLDHGAVEGLGEFFLGDPKRQRQSGEPGEGEHGQQAGVQSASDAPALHEALPAMV